MEILYARLHEKYEKLKDRKINELDNHLQDQENNFMNYVKVAEGLVDGLRSENEILRSSCYEYEQLLTEEREKTKELKKVVERYQVLQKERDIPLMEEHVDNIGTRKQNTDIVHSSSPGDAGVSSEGAVIISTTRSPHFQSAVAQPKKICQLDLPGTFSELNLHGGPLSDDDQDHQQPNCTVENPVSAEECRSPDFMLLTLMESLTNMKLSIVKEAEKTFLLAVHQASGYSFRLSFTNEAEKTDLFYEVVSLGTIGRLALEWMKEDIILGLNMFPLFMFRLSTALDPQSCRMVK